MIEPGLEKALEIHCWDRIESYASVFQKCKMLGGFEVHTEETQRCSDLPGCGPGQMVHIPQSSHCADTPWSATPEHRETAMKWDTTWPKDSTWKTYGITAAPKIRYCILILVIIMFLNKWVKDRKTAPLASVRAARDPWEQITCGCRKKSPQIQDLRSTSLLQIRATWLKQPPEYVRKVRFVYFLTEINW